MARWHDLIELPVATTETQAPDEKYVLAMQVAIETGNPSSTFALLTNTATASAVFRNHPKIQRSYLLSSDPRTRLLASAIAATFSHAGNLATDTLSAAMSGSNGPEAVVIDSRPSEKSSSTAVLQGLKYLTAAGGSGQQGFELATRQMHCELIVIHSNCLKWSLSDTVANLRTDYRTRNTPIVIFGPKRDEAATSMITTRNRGIWFIPQPLSEITFTDHLRIAEIPAPVLSNEERNRMIRFAQSVR